MSRLPSRPSKLSYSQLEQRNVLTSFLPADVSVTTIGGNGTPITDYIVEVTADPASEETNVAVTFNRTTGDIVVREQTGLDGGGNPTFSSQTFDLLPRSSILRTLVYNGNDFRDTVIANLPGFQHLCLLYTSPSPRDRG